MNDLLSLINFHLPFGATIPSSTYLLDKSIGLDFGSATKNIDREQCESLVEGNSEQCKSCQTVLEPNQLVKNGRFFVFQN